MSNLATRKTVLLAKTESSYGVDAGPSASVDGLTVSEVAVKPMGDVLERDIYRHKFSKAAPIIGAKEMQVTFKVEIKGSGSAGTAPAMGKLLKACGMGETISAGVSVTYAPESDDDEVDSLTLYVYKDKILHKVTGARGTYTVDAQAGKYGIVAFTFKGLYKRASDVDAPTLSNLETTVPQMIRQANFSWGGYSAVASKLALDWGAKVVRREDFNASFGVGAFRVSDRDPKGSFNPDAVTEATHPFWGDWDDETVRALAITIGETAGNICTINAPKCFSEGPEYENDEGVAKYNVPFRMTENSASGDDEISIVFT